jgi:hypothetical protein
MRSPWPAAPAPTHSVPSHAERSSGATTGLYARKVLGWPKRCQLAHVFLWEYSYKRLELAQILGQLGAFLT